MVSRDMQNCKDFLSKACREDHEVNSQAPWLARKRNHEQIGNSSEQVTAVVHDKKLATDGRFASRAVELPLFYHNSNQNIPALRIDFDYTKFAGAAARSGTVNSSQHLINMSPTNGNMSPLLRPSANTISDGDLNLILFPNSGAYSSQKETKTAGNHGARDSSHTLQLFPDHGSYRRNKEIVPENILTLENAVSKETVDLLSLGQQSGSSFTGEETLLSGLDNEEAYRKFAASSSAFSNHSGDMYSAGSYFWRNNMPLKFYHANPGSTSGSVGSYQVGKNIPPPGFSTSSIAYAKASIGFPPRSADFDRSSKRLQPMGSTYAGTNKVILADDSASDKISQGFTGSLYDKTNGGILPVGSAASSVCNSTAIRGFSHELQMDSTGSDSIAIFNQSLPNMSSNFYGKSTDRNESASNALTAEAHEVGKNKDLGNSVSVEARKGTVGKSKGQNPVEKGTTKAASKPGAANTKDSKAKIEGNVFPANVKSLLSTGIFDGIPVKYVSWDRTKTMRGSIQGDGYLCWCTQCNKSKVVNAFQLEQHAGSKSKHPNNFIFFSNGKSIYSVVQELKNTPSDKLMDVIQNVTGSQINEANFSAWKASFQSANRENFRD